MTNDPNRNDKDLPVTAEVGDEGGSFTDAVVQEATRDGDVARVDRRDTERDAGSGQRAEEVSPSSDEVEDGVHFSPQRNRPINE